MKTENKVFSVEDINMFGCRCFEGSYTSTTMAVDIIIITIIIIIITIIIIIIIIDNYD